MPGKRKVFTKKGDRVFEALKKKYGPERAAAIASSKPGSRMKPKKKKR